MAAKKYKLDQVAIRMVREKPLYSTEPIDSPEKAVKLLSDAIKDYDREVVCVINLNSSLQPINLNICSMGAIDRAIVCPREVLKTSILSNASSVMLLHNHPSGNCHPSEQDVYITDRMQEVYKLMDIKLLDHVIIGDDQYYSFTENRVMPESQLSFTSIMELYQLKHGIEAQKLSVESENRKAEDNKSVVAENATYQESDSQERKHEHSRMSPEEEKDVEAEKMTAHKLAAMLDQWYQDFDMYEYKDTVSNTETNISELEMAIEAGQIEKIKEFIEGVIEEHEGTEDDIAKGKELLSKLDDYKPLAKVEDIEEQNYNMIDNRINNIEPKDEKSPEKKEERRTSADKKYPNAKYSHFRIQRKDDDLKYNLIADVLLENGKIEKDQLIGELKDRETVVAFCKQNNIAYDDITNYLQTMINHKKKKVAEREAAGQDSPVVGKKGKGEVAID